MNSRSPIGTASVHSPFRQTVDCCIARRDLHFPRTNVESKAAHQSDFSCDGELCVALSQCLLRQLAIRDVSSDSKQTQWLAVGPANSGGFERNPMLLAVCMAGDWCE